MAKRIFSKSTSGLRFSDPARKMMQNGGQVVANQNAERWYYCPCIVVEGSYFLFSGGIVVFMQTSGSIVVRMVVSLSSFNKSSLAEWWSYCRTMVVLLSHRRRNVVVAYLNGMVVLLSQVLMQSTGLIVARGCSIIPGPCRENNTSLLFCNGETTAILFGPIFYIGPEFQEFVFFLS